MEVRVLFAKPKKFKIGSLIIRWAEGLSFSHTALFVDGWVYESVWPVARRIHYTKWRREYDIVEMYQPGSATFEQIRWLDSMKGSKYSILQIIIMGLGIIYAPIDKIFRQKSINGSKFLVCTEYVAWYLLKFKGFEWSDSPDHISLTELREALTKKYRRVPWLS